MEARSLVDPARWLREQLSCGQSACPCRRTSNTHCPCGAHDHGDRHPSLTVHVLAGKLLVNCKKGTPQRELVAVLKDRGLWPDSGTDAAPEPRQTAPQPLERLVAVYQYITADGEIAGEKGRFERPDGSKTFRWRKPGTAEWSGGIKTAEMPLYGSEAVAQTDAIVPVWYVEGEKAVEALTEQGQLAVTHGGGASQKDFGDALEVLRGRDVLLWPDNDPAGRECMARIHGLLKPIARSLTVVQPAGLPEKGDAHDYFQAGGAVKDILDNLPPVRADVRHLAHDAVQVRVPTPMGVVSLTFSEMEKTARELAAEIEVRLEGPGMSEEAYSQRLNLLSSSQRTELRRDLESLYSKDYKWPSVLNTALALARSAYLEQDRGLTLREIPDPGEPELLIDPLLPAGAATVIFGDGSAGKTYICLRSAIGVASGRDVAGLPTKRGAVLFVDYENTPATFALRLRRLYAGLGYEEPPELPIHYWPARGIPVHDQIDALRRKVLKEGITLVIVDSAAAACGGEPEKADVALRYFNALSKLGESVASWTIAHITKGGDSERPFGSAFWHNTPRRTWYVARVQEEESDVIDVGMYCRKVNDGHKPAPIGLRITFTERIGPVRVERSQIQDTPELASKRGLAALIWDALYARQATVYEIGHATADAMGVDMENASERARHIGNIGRVLRGKKDRFENVEAGTEFGGRGKQAIWKRRDTA